MIRLALLIKETKKTLKKNKNIKSRERERREGKKQQELIKG